MANKKISDLQLRSNFDDTCNLAADDASQTWRVTGAQLKAFLAGVALITDKTEDTAPQSVDQILVYDDSADGLKKVSKANLLKKSLATKTTTYTADEEDDILLGDGSGGAFSITLPAAAGIAGKVYTFKKIDSSANAVTIDGNASETIDGATTYTLTIQYESISIVSDGTNWSII